MTAAVLHPRGRVAELRQKFTLEPVLPGHLTHDLHQSPGAGPGRPFRLVTGAEYLALIRHVMSTESRLEADRPIITAALGSDNSADQPFRKAEFDGILGDKFLSLRGEHGAISGAGLSGGFDSRK